MSTTGSPIVDRMIQPFRRGAAKVKEFADHPLDTISSGIKEMLTPEPQNQAHEQAIQQMNAETNAHKNDAANASFKPKMLPRAK